MIRNTTANLDVIRTIAKALGELNDRVAYVGGTVVSLYINDPAADDARPTKDIDISLEIASLSELEKVRGELTRKGFWQSPEDNVICRFRYNDVKVDVMSTKEVGWAPSNPWFGPGFKHLEQQKIENTTIHILPLAYFLASKFSAFHDRGAKDPRTSRDFEDIVYILDNRTDIVEVIAQSPDDVRNFLKGEFQRILKSDALQESIVGNLFYETQTKRFTIIMERLKNIVHGI
jgi:predicted nucleotidyltransferase